MLWVKPEMFPVPGIRVGLKLIVALFEMFTLFPRI